jgi:anti-anti-sigma factor
MTVRRVLVAGCGRTIESRPRSNRGILDELDERRETAGIDAVGIKPPPAYTLRDAAAPAGVVLLALGGELDLAAAPLLRSRVDAAEGALVLDFARVTFIDSAVLKELLRARAELSARGVRFVLAAVPRPVLRLLELTRTAELFVIAADAGEALRTVSRAS